MLKIRERADKRRGQGLFKSSLVTSETFRRVSGPFEKITLVILAFVQVYPESIRVF